MSFVDKIIVGAKGVWKMVENIAVTLKGYWGQLADAAGGQLNDQAFASAIVTARAAKPDTDYNDTVDKIWDYYAGVHGEHNLDNFRTLMPTTYKNTENGAYLRQAKRPVVKRFAKQICICTAHWPTVGLRRTDGTIEQGGSAAQTALDAMLDHTDFFRIIHKAEIMRCILGVAILSPAWRAGTMYLDLYRASQIEVKESPICPRDWRRAAGILIKNDLPKNIDASQTQTWTLWALDERAVAGEPTLIQDWRSYQVTDGGSLQANPLFPDNVNYYGTHPVCFWYEEPSTSNVFPELDETLLNDQETANRMGTEFQIHFSYSSFGRPWIKGWEGKERAIPTSPDTWIELADSPTSGAGTVSAASDIEALAAADRGSLKTAAQLHGLDPGTFDIEKPSILTGAAIAQGQVGFNDERFTRAYGMKKDIESLLSRMIIVWNYWQRRMQRTDMVIDERLRPFVEFDLQELNNPSMLQSNAQASAIDNDLGKYNAIDNELAKQGLTRRTATPEQENDARQLVYRRRGESAGLKALDAKKAETVQKKSDNETSE